MFNKTGTHGKNISLLKFNVNLYRKCIYSWYALWLIVKMAYPSNVDDEDWRAQNENRGAVNGSFGSAIIRREKSRHGTAFMTISIASRAARKEQRRTQEGPEARAFLCCQGEFAAASLFLAKANRHHTHPRDAFRRCSVHGAACAPPPRDSLRRKPPLRGRHTSYFKARRSVPTSSFLISDFSGRTATASTPDQLVDCVL